MAYTYYAYSTRANLSNIAYKEGQLIFETDQGNNSKIYHDVNNVRNEIGGKTDVIDSLTSTEETSALSANQGKQLNEDKVDKDNASLNNVTVTNGDITLTNGEIILNEDYSGLKSEESIGIYANTDTSSGDNIKPVHICSSRGTSPDLTTGLVVYGNKVLFNNEEVSFGNATQLQGRTVASTAPSTTNNYLKWVSNSWQPSSIVCNSTSAIAFPHNNSVTVSFGTSFANKTGLIYYRYYTSEFGGAVQTSVETCTLNASGSVTLSGTNAAATGATPTFTFFWFS